MAWVIPNYSKGEVDKACAALLSRSATDEDYQVVENWRSAHNYPLKIFQADLHRRANRVYQQAIVAQRIKRLASVVEKLKRFRTMRLSAVQEIGGCRAVVHNVRQVNQLAKRYEEHPAVTQELVGKKDYMRAPKPDGYRGIHLIYKYTGRKSAYLGLKIEIQLRTVKAACMGNGCGNRGILHSPSA